MHFRWLFVAIALVVVGCALSDATTVTSTEAPSEPTTTADATTVTTEGPETKSTDENGPVTDPPVEPQTDDPATEKTDKPITTTKKEEKTTSKASATTEGPQPDAEKFKVTCDDKTSICTYSMQVPGLDIDTFTSLMNDVNKTDTDVKKYKDEDFVELQNGVTKVYSEAEATANYVAVQVEAIKQEITDLQTQTTSLDSAIKALNTAVYNANAALSKIIAKRGSCLSRVCILKETTTPKPTTTTTVKTTPTPFCSIGDNAQTVCKNGGHCENYYKSYYCTCKGNLDGQENDCKTSVCEVVKDAQAPGLIYSPGYDGNEDSNLDENGDEITCEDGAQWTINGTKSLRIKPDSQPPFSIANLKKSSNLQLSVGKYKLKITSTTKLAQINQILGYGSSATFSYTSTEGGYFSMELEEVETP